MLVLAFIIVLSIVLLVADAAPFRTATMGWDKRYVSAAQAMSFSTGYLAAESIAYYPGKSYIIAGNINVGAPSVPDTYAFPYAYVPMQPVAVTPSTGMIKITNGRNNETACNPNPTSGSCASNQGTFGLAVDPANSEKPVLWSCLGQYPPSATSACGISVANLDDTTYTPENGLSPLHTYTWVKSTSKSGLACLIDDVVVGAGGNIYATDFFGYRIVMIQKPGAGWNANYDNGITSVLSENLILCSSDPTSGCTGSSGDGPNGIVTWTDENGKNWLLINVSPNKLVKMDAVSGAATVINQGKNTPPGALIANDGIAFSNGVLYAVGYPIAGTDPASTVSAITTADGWTTYDVRTVFNSNCPGPSWYDPAVRVGNGNDLIVLCNNNFQGGVQQVNVLSQVGGGFFATQFITLTEPYLYPEGFGYDPKLNRLVMGSVSNGRIIGIPYDANSVNTFDAVEAYTYIAATVPPVKYLGINVNPMNVFGNSCYALACQGGGSAPVVTRLCLINLCTKTNVQCIDLPTAAPSVSSANDVTVLGSTAYVSDWLGGLVWAVDIARDTSNLWSLTNARVALTKNKCASNVPTACITHADGMETVSQDLFGNMLATPYILISNFARADGSPGGLFKYVPSTQSLTYVTEPTGIVTGLDSMKFNGAQNILYGTRGSFNGQNTYNTVVAVVSCDGWATASLAYSFQTSCIKTTNTAGSIPPNPPGVQLIQNVVTGTEDLVIMCNGGFSGADVGFQIVKNANNYVTNTKISSVCGITPPSPPPVPPPVPPTPVSTATSSSKSATVAIVGSTGGILLIILMVYWYYTTQNKKAALAAADGASKSGIDNKV